MNARAEAPATMATSTTDAGSDAGNPTELASAKAGDRWPEGLVDRLDPPSDFNFRHFRMRHMAAELIRTFNGSGMHPGGEAPDFELETTTGERLRLHDLRGRPVLVHFVSYTCPVTRGAASLMRELHHRFGDRIQFVDIVVRQAHPGERRGPYRSYTSKLNEGRLYQQEEDIGWPVAVDDLEGTVQRAYGGLAASIYLLDAHGKVSFYSLWGAAPPLTEALDDLLRRGGTGWPTGTGIDRRPHLGGAIVAGQGGPARGGIQSFVDLELGFPGGLFLMTVGRLARPLLAPLVIRITPLPTRARLVIVASAAVGAVAIVAWRRRAHSVGAA